MTRLSVLWVGCLLVSVLQAAPQPKERRDDYDYQLPQTSPDGKYAIEVAEAAEQAMVYRWVTVKAHAVLLEIKSSYQPDASDPATRRYAREQAEGAMAFWSSDSRYVAIEEEVNHGSGDTVIAFLAGPGPAELIKVPREQIAEATKEQWRRSHLAFQRWEKDGKLRLSLSGDALANKSDRTATAKLKHATYDIVLQRSGTIFRIEKIFPTAAR